jgi:hypothetical protein
MDIKRYCDTIWAINGTFVLAFILFVIVEIVSHGSSWQGVFNAVTKHVQNSCYSQGVFICDSFKK